MAPKRRARKADVVSEGALQDKPESASQVCDSVFAQKLVKIRTEYGFTLACQEESSGVPAGDSNVADVVASQQGARRRPREAAAGAMLCRFLHKSTLCISVYGSQSPSRDMAVQCEHRDACARQQ